MEEQLATLSFASIMTIGSLVWLWSLQKTLAIDRRATHIDWHTIPDQQVAGDIETGSRVVAGEPEALSRALAKTLAQSGIGGFMPLFEIWERTSNRIILKKPGRSSATNRLGCTLVRPRLHSSHWATTEQRLLMC
jgi:hypothetical protein